MTAPPISPRRRWMAYPKDFTRWGLVATLIYAPFACGSTPDLPKLILSILLQVLLAGFCLGLLTEWRSPRIPKIAASLTLALLFYGWFMIFNARQEFDADLYLYLPVQPFLPFLPGAVDRAWAMPRMLMITGMIGAFWITCDAASNPKWRNRLWLAICGTGIGIMLLGLVERFTGAETVYWQDVERMAGFFATYRYHANAGAFINLVLPFIAFRAILAFRQKSSHVARAAWLLATFITAACAFINISRAAMIITAILLAILGGQQLLYRLKRQRPAQAKWTWAMATITLAVIFLLVWSFGWDQTRDKWVLGADNLVDNSRYLVYDAIIHHALPSSGFWGFGPGTFQITFPFFTNQLGDRIAGVWRYAHEDYLQTLMEWGWAGAALWAALIFGGAIRSLIQLRWKTNDLPSYLLLQASLLALLGVLLHALVDFPLQIASLQLYVAVALAFIWKLPYAPSAKSKAVVPEEDTARKEHPAV